MDCVAEVDEGECGAPAVATVPFLTPGGTTLHISVCAAHVPTCEAVEIFDNSDWLTESGSPIHEVPCKNAATVVVDSEDPGGSMLMCAEHARGTLHAHVTTRSRDCDGEYRRGHTAVPTHEEQASKFGELDFKHRVLSTVISLYPFHAMLEVTPEGANWRETTDEGYVSTDVEWCEDPDCAGDSPWQRDLSAERAGY